MESLPVEIIFHICSFLDALDIVQLQTVSRRFLSLTRDSHLWKQLCYINSRSATIARRQLHLSIQSRRLSALVQAMATLPSAWPSPPEIPSSFSHDWDGKGAREVWLRSRTQREQARKLANWDPSYTTEKVDWYKEYIQRHAQIKVSWFQRVLDGAGNEKREREAVGMGVLYRDEARADKLVAPMDDGSICVWDMAPDDTFGQVGRKGRMISRTQVGLLAGRGCGPDKSRRLSESRAIMTETGAVECVSIDSKAQKGYFAVQDCLNEVDLYTLQVVSKHEFPFPITTLSSAQSSVPITVGTYMTLHLHDPRQPLRRTAEEVSTHRCELIGGTASTIDPLAFSGATRGHVTLSQPGPLSILHMPTSKGSGPSNDIWVAGRFTSLLGYDRRFFPKIARTIHSGARLSSLTSLQYPFIPRAACAGNDVGLSIAQANAARGIPGSSIIAAGEYNTKGSLEIYGLSTHPDYDTLCQHHKPFGEKMQLQNRQTASRCKLLSVANHGTSIVYSDGDGKIKWVERNGFTPIRQWNLNPEFDSDVHLANIANLNSAPGNETTQPVDDIVQKMIPIPVSSSANTTQPENLLLWTGEGKLGLLSYGNSSKLDTAAFEEPVSAEQEARLKTEREYAGEMRRALERQADEVRWLGGLRFS